jgi:rubrerythrin
VVNPVSQLFLDLAAMEAEHEKVFAFMRADLADQEQKPTVFDSDFYPGFRKNFWERG